MFGVVKTDKMFGTDNRAGLVSVRYQPSGAMTAIENGNVVKLGALEDGSREIFAGETPAADTAINAIALIATPEVCYDERKRNLEDFRNEAGDIARGYILHSGDIFSVTKEALDGVAEPAVGNIVELMAGTKLSVAASATGSTVVGKIIAVEQAGRYKFYAIKVD